MIGEDLRVLIKDRIDNFLGYGDPDSPIWLMGMEEGVPKELTEKDYCNIFNGAKRDGHDFTNIKNSMWKEDLSKRKSGDHFWGGNYDKMWMLLSSLEGSKDVFGGEDCKGNMNSEEMSNLKDCLGKTVRGRYSNCLIEFNPIPFYKKKNDFLWEYIKKEYGDGVNKSLKSFDVKVLRNFLDLGLKSRANMIKKKIKNHEPSPKKIICYGLGYGNYFKKIGDSDFKDKDILDKGKKICSISYGKLGKTKIFIIPHCSNGCSYKKYKLIADFINHINS